MEFRDRSLWSYLPAFFLGGLIGAGAMLFFAPQSGEDTREQLLQKGRQLKRKAVETAEVTTTRTGKMVGELSGRARDTASSIFRRGQITAEEYKSNIEEEAKSKSVQFRQG